MILLVLCELVLAALAGRAVGWSADVVMSGSMAPGILPGDVVLTQPATATQLRPGQVVLVRDPAHPGRLLMHRLVERRPDGSLVTKGDANADADSTPVPADWVRGLPRLRLPFIGLPELWLALGRYHLVTGFGLGVTLAVALAVPG